MINFSCDDMSVIYLTNCSAEKDDELRGTGELVSPKDLYKSDRIQDFIKMCESEDVNWAIFSDNYGVYFPFDRHEWYDKPPGSVSDEEFDDLVRSFENRLADFDRVIFYREKDSFPDLFRKLIKTVDFGGEVILIDDLGSVGDF